MTEWNRPVIVFYRERTEKPENRAFAVVKALKLAFTEEENKLKGKIEEFFPLMGDIENISSAEVLQFIQSTGQ